MLILPLTIQHLEYHLVRKNYHVVVVALVDPCEVIVVAVVVVRRMLIHVLNEVHESIDDWNFVAVAAAVAVV